jgi:pre-mRNA-splicing factor CWC22
LSDLVGLELLYILLETPTEDSVELACDFMIECGQVMSDIAPQHVSSIFERFKGILHEGEINRKVQYRIESLFAVRKTKFVDHPGIIPELDLVEDEDQITHQIDVFEDIDPEDNLNLF